MDWLWGAIAGAVATGAVGALGFLFNSLVLQPASKRREARQQSILALQDLNSLLAISFDAFRNQNFKAQMLLRFVQKNHPEIATSKPDGTSLGYDEIFHNAYHVFTSDEMELFQLIRGTTLTSLHDTNSKMQNWIESHSQFVLGAQPNVASRGW